jgi:hypothetical protein
MSDITKELADSVDILQNNLNIDTSKDSWITTQITSILMIIFFGIIAITYILFANTHILKKENDNLSTSMYFKLPMLGFVVISSIIMIVIMAYSSKIPASSANLIIGTIFVLNIVIIAKIFLDNKDYALKIKDVINNISSSKYVTMIINNTMLKIFGQPVFSYLSPLLIELSIILSYKASNILMSIMYITICIVLAFEYLIRQRYYAISDIFDNIDQNSKGFMYRLLFIVSYICSIVVFGYFLSQMSF